jgi:hypothetical protein
MVNVCFFGSAGQKEWVLVDAGIPGTAPLIADAAANLFGKTFTRGLPHRHARPMPMPIKVRAAAIGETGYISTQTSRTTT